MNEIPARRTRRAGAPLPNEKWRVFPGTVRARMVCCTASSRLRCSMSEITPAVVTGGNRGLGLALTKILAREGLVISTFRDERASSELLDLVRANGHVHALRLDVRMNDGTEEFGERCRT